MREAECVKCGEALMVFTFLKSRNPRIVLLFPVVREIFQV